eukprot:1224460-Pleurochrysis_carterae.AAC.4
MLAPPLSLTLSTAPSASLEAVLRSDARAPSHRLSSPPSHRLSTPPALLTHSLPYTTLALSLSLAFDHALPLTHGTLDALALTSPSTCSRTHVHTRAQILYADYVVVFELLLPWLGLSSHCCMLILLFLAISALALRRRSTHD